MRNIFKHDSEKKNSLKLAHRKHISKHSRCCLVSHDLKPVYWFAKQPLFYCVQKSFLCCKTWPFKTLSRYWQVTAMFWSWDCLGFYYSVLSFEPSQAAMMWIMTMKWFDRDQKDKRKERKVKPITNCKS